jgi:hypothetical protein
MHMTASLDGVTPYVYMKMDSRRGLELKVTAWLCNCREKVTHHNTKQHNTNNTYWGTGTPQGTSHQANNYNASSALAFATDSGN